MVRKVLLICGILSGLLYIGSDIAAAVRYDGYSYTDQVVSELSAIGAPTRGFLVPLYIAYDVLLMAFAVGVWTSAGPKQSLRAVAAALAANAIVGLVAPFPMTTRGGEMTFTDMMHIVIIGVTVLSFLVAISVGGNAFGKKFRLYSIATVLTSIASVAATAVQAPKMEANLSTPWLGLIERVSVYAFVLWVLVLAVLLLRAQRTAPRHQPRWEKRFVAGV